MWRSRDLHGASCEKGPSEDSHIPPCVRFVTPSRTTIHCESCQAFPDLPSLALALSIFSLPKTQCSKKKGQCSRTEREVEMLGYPNKRAKQGKEHHGQMDLQCESPGVQ